MEKQVFLEIRGVEKAFGQGETRVNVLQGIDLAVYKGEFIVLLGPSGSGKSTLLNTVDALAVVIFLIVVYLLLKLIIEKSAHTVSVMRILGLRGKEIGGIYMISLSASVAVSFVLSIAIDYYFLKALYKVMIGQMMKGWLPLDIGADVFVKMILLGLGAYAAVALLEYRKLRRIPMDLALKTVE